MTSRIIIPFTGSSNSIIREVTDIILTRGSQVLLIERGHQPFKGKWALPGGHVDPEDVLAVCQSKKPKGLGRWLMYLTGEWNKIGAMREAEEEVGFKPDPKEFRQVLTVVRDSSVDPRGPTLTRVFHYDVPYTVVPVAGDDAVATKWFPIKELTREMMAFDHYDLIQEWLQAQKVEMEE